jgi:hypothetical protein
MTDSVDWRRTIATGCINITIRIRSHVLYCWCWQSDVLSIPQSVQIQTWNLCEWCGEFEVWHFLGLHASWSIREEQIGKSANNGQKTEFETSITHQWYLISKWLYNVTKEI